jgi:hypothetical protein
MVDLEGETSNRLFETLEEWDRHLTAAGIDPEEPPSCEM